MILIILAVAVVSVIAGALAARSSRQNEIDQLRAQLDKANVVNFEVIKFNTELLAEFYQTKQTPSKLRLVRGGK